MKTLDFVKKITSTTLQENIEKQFGTRVNLDQYNREQLEDFRNKLRTKVFQHENGAGINDLLTNEQYQKDKAMLELLNTRIKEMLGENMKKLRDKMVELDETKKGMRPKKHAQPPKGAKKGDQDHDGDKDFADVMSARMQASGKSKAAANAAVKNKPYNKESKKVKENDETPEWDPEIEKPEYAKTNTTNVKKVAGKAYGGSAQKDEKEVDEAAAKCNHTAEGVSCPVHGMKECGMYEAKKKPSAGLSKKKKSAVAKKARKGGDIGKKGKAFKDVEAAAKKGGARDPKAVAAAAMWKNIKRENVETFKKNVRVVNESLARLLREDEEQKAKAITAAGDIVNDYTSWMQRVGQYQTKALIELGDDIRAEFGPAEAEAFKQAVGPALAATLETLTAQREIVSNAVAALAGEAPMPQTMGGEAPAPEAGAEEPGMEPAAPDEMNAPSDEFAASAAAAGGEEAAGREMRESREQRRARKLAEQHSIISKLAR